MDGKYTIEMCRPAGEDAGIERVFERQDNLAIARKLYRILANEHPDRLIMLCDRARVLGAQRPARHNAALMPLAVQFRTRAK